jgi:Rrf2 family nitric oxide-sensitive transcriptional repressor
MNLTQYTDFSLRTLMFLAAAERSSTISEIAGAFGISRNHLVKVVHRLAKQGFIVSTRGKSGGIALARAPQNIRIGDVVRTMEPRFQMAECFAPGINHCPITPVCRLTGVLREAEAAFMAVLNGYTLHDVVSNREALREHLGLELPDTMNAAVPERI